jgi:hypothetical protein
MEALTESDYADAAIAAMDEPSAHQRALNREPYDELTIKLETQRYEAVRSALQKTVLSATEPREIRELYDAINRLDRDFDEYLDKHAPLERSDQPRDSHVAHSETDAERHVEPATNQRDVIDELSKLARDHNAAQTLDYSERREYLAGLFEHYHALFDTLGNDASLEEIREFHTIKQQLVSSIAQIVDQLKHADEMPDDDSDLADQIFGLEQDLGEAFDESREGDDDEPPEYMKLDAIHRQQQPEPYEDLTQQARDHNDEQGRNYDELQEYCADLMHQREMLVRQIKPDSTMQQINEINRIIHQLDIQLAETEDQIEQHEQRGDERNAIHLNTILRHQQPDPYVELAERVRAHNEKQQQETSFYGYQFSAKAWRDRSFDERRLSLYFDAAYTRNTTAGFRALQQLETFERRHIAELAEIGLTPTKYTELGRAAADAAGIADHRKNDFIIQWLKKTYGDGYFDPTDILEHEHTLMDESRMSHITDEDDFADAAILAMYDAPDQLAAIQRQQEPEPYDDLTGQIGEHNDLADRRVYHSDLSSQRDMLVRQIKPGSSIEQINEINKIIHQLDIQLMEVEDQLDDLSDNANKEIEDDQTTKQPRFDDSNSSKSDNDYRAADNDHREPQRGGGNEQDNKQTPRRAATSAERDNKEEELDPKLAAELAAFHKQAAQMADSVPMKIDTVDLPPAPNPRDRRALKRLSEFLKRATGARQQAPGLKPSPRPGPGL